MTPLFAQRFAAARLVLMPALAVWPLLLATAEIQFNRDVRPVLADACFHCHGPDPGSREAGLRLDTHEGLFGGRSPVIDLDDLEDSELLYRITVKDPDDAMPPPDHSRQLEEAEVNTLKEWILQGAQWEPHWSFNVPLMTEPPQVEDREWPRNAIDSFVLARLESGGLAPTPEADPRALVRRLSLDLTGLPPDSELVERFAANPSEEAYQALVDDFLKSKSYGEHRARYWLDAARYADTHGLHFDNYREMWPYRDWVVRAFNRNQPFDQFTVEQLAGDLLENPTRDQLIATGFQRCNITTNEGGTIVEENLANYAADRVQTLGWVYLGLTTNCAQCHDHKFDPFTTKDYYSMAAFFRNTTQGGLDGNVKDGRGPAIVVPSREDSARWDALPGEISTSEQRLAERRRTAGSAFQAWLEQQTPTTIADGLPAEGLVVHHPLNEGEGYGVPWEESGKLGPSPQLRQGQTISLEESVGDLEADQAFTLGAWIRPTHLSQNVGVIARMNEDNAYRGWDLFQQGDRLAVHLIHQWPEAAIKVTTRQPVLKEGEWRHVGLVWDGSLRPEGIRLFIDGTAQELEVNNRSLKGGQTIRTEVPLIVGRRTGGNAFEGSVQDFRFYDRALDESAISKLAAQGALLALLEIPEKERDAEQRERLWEHYLMTEDPVYGAEKENLAVLEAERESIRARSPVTHIQEEKDRPAMANILMRGQYDQVGEAVEASTPVALFPMPEDAPRNRLGLAQWIVSPENPLTARVTVNRFWQEVFGQGLVATSEDFGVMGALPSHPETVGLVGGELS